MPISSTGAPYRPRSTVHLNIADFAVAVERQIDAGLRLRPVIVSHGTGARAIVHDMSEEAYGAGIRKTMPLPLAMRRCRDAIVLPPRPDRYERAMTDIFREISDFSPLVEPGEIDGHFFIDITGTSRLSDHPWMWPGECIAASGNDSGLPPYGRLHRTSWSQR